MNTSWASYGVWWTQERPGYTFPRWSVGTISNRKPVKHYANFMFTELFPELSTVLGGLAVVGTAILAGYRFGYNAAIKALNSEREANRFSEIYAPLFGLFLTRHITTATCCAAPYFRQRFHNACDELLHERRPVMALKALFDKQNLGTSGGVEYGGGFPLTQIIKCLQGKEKFADQTLINLVRSADRAQYEEMSSSSELTEADLELFNHICNEHTRLNRRFIRA